MLRARPRAPSPWRWAGTSFAFARNTTIAVVATDAVLTKTGAKKLAQLAHNGLARTICPVHSTLDGDTIFALSTGSSGVTLDVSVLGTIAADVLADAVLRAVEHATGLDGIPSAKQFSLR